MGFAFLLQPNVGTYLGPYAIGGPPSRGPVVCTHTTHKHRSSQPHPTCRDARSSVRKRRAINEGPSFKRHMGDWHINVGTHLGASAIGGAPSRGRTPTCQSLIYFWGTYLPCIWLCASYPTAPPIHCSGRALCRPTSTNKRKICNACNNQPPNSRDARSSVRTNEQPNRIRSLTYVDKHNLLIIIRLYDACGRSNERPYGLVG